MQKNTQKRKDTREKRAIFKAENMTLKSKEEVQVIASKLLSVNLLNHHS